MNGHANLVKLVAVAFLVLPACGRGADNSSDADAGVDPDAGGS